MDNLILIENTIFLSFAFFNLKYVFTFTMCFLFIEMAAKSGVVS